MTLLLIQFQQLSMAGASSRLSQAHLVSDATWLELCEILSRHRQDERLDQKRIDERIVSFSAELLGRRFGLGPTGEGFKAPLSLPILELTSFDCLTFVETVIALALASSADHAVAIIMVLRYGRGSPTFATRNHFAGVDWVPSAIQHGLLEYSLPPHEYSKSKINVRRTEWCDRLVANPMYKATLSRGGVESSSIQLQCRRSAALNDSYEFGFVPIHVLEKSRHLQSGRILLILRPGSPQNSYAGGGDHVSHMGIAVKEGGRWMFRAASQRKRRVADVELDSLLGSSQSSGAGYGVGVFKVISPRRAALSTNR